DMAANGGLIDHEDLSAYRFERRRPVRGSYRGYEIVSTPPASSGGTCIVECLKLLEGFDVRAMGFGSTESIHLLAEVLKIVFTDRSAFMGDPAFVDVPVDRLTSAEYASVRRREIDLKRAGSFGAGDPTSLPRESANTTHWTVLDREGNVVAMTQT